MRSLVLLGALVISCRSLAEGACSTYNGHLNIPVSVNSPVWPATPVCVFLAPKSCPSTSVGNYDTANFRENYIYTGANTNRTGGAHVSWLVGGTTAFQVGSFFWNIGDLTGNVWKLYQNYPGTFFSSASSYQIAMSGGVSYFWDGPLAGGTGLVKSGTAPATASGISGAPSHSLVLCTVWQNTQVVNSAGANVAAVATST